MHYCFQQFPEQVLMTVPFGYAVAGPSTTGDIYSVFIGA